MYPLEETLQKTYIASQARLDHLGHGDDPQLRILKNFKYWEGQRAETSWMFEEVTTPEEILEKGAVSTEAQLYIMENCLAWQEVDYERYVCV